MNRLFFPMLVGVLVLGWWLAITLIEDCVRLADDPKFDCGSAMSFVAVFASFGAVLSMMAAGLARALVHPYLPIRSIGAESVAAVLSSIALVLLFYGAVQWRVDMGGMAGILVGWLLSGFVLSGLSLLGVHRFMPRS